MKKIGFLVTTLVVMIVLLVCASYSVSKTRAEAIARHQSVPLSPLRGQLVLFQDNKMTTPCWMFRAEYTDAITGSTFDIYMSIVGEEIIKGKRKGLNKEARMNSHNPGGTAYFVAAVV